MLYFPSEYRNLNIYRGFLQLLICVPVISFIPSTFPLIYLRMYLDPEGPSRFWSHLQGFFLRRQYGTATLVRSCLVIGDFSLLFPDTISCISTFIKDLSFVVVRFSLLFGGGSSSYCALALVRVESLCIPRVSSFLGTIFAAA